MSELLILCAAVVAWFVWDKVRREGFPEYVGEVQSELRDRAETYRKAGNEAKAAEADRVADSIQTCAAIAASRSLVGHANIDVAQRDVLWATNSLELSKLGIHQGTRRFQRCYSALMDLARQVSNVRKRSEKGR